LHDEGKYAAVGEALSGFFYLRPPPRPIDRLGPAALLGAFIASRAKFKCVASLTIVKGTEREDSSKQKDQPKEGESSERKKDDVAGENKGLRITVIRVEINRDDADKHYHEGLRLHNSGKCEEAIKEFDKALVIDPNFKEAHYYKGVCLYYLRRYEETIKEFDRALAIDPNDSWAHYYKGEALCYLGDCEGAIKEYDKALAIDPDFTLARDNRELALKALKRFRK